MRMLKLDIEGIGEEKHEHRIRSSYDDAVLHHRA